MNVIKDLMRIIWQKISCGERKKWDKIVYSYLRRCHFILNLLLRDPRQIKFTNLWIRSLSPGHSSLSDQLPWITFEAREWLTSYLKPSMSVFEYGSGGSTIFFSKRVKRLISIEHDKEYYSQVSTALSKERISNCKYILCEPEKNISGEISPYSPESYTSRLKEYVGMSFETYVKSIKEYPDGEFDLVFIDGRARLACILHSMAKIRSGGYLMLDNSDRQEYHKGKCLLADYKRADFFGIGPYSLEFWQTSVWKLKSIKLS